jgi:coproporphyrinogen III oxidase-like Fe-S oxidoreductase
MSDYRSRLTTFVERRDKGLDTHRDDIGTLTERKNRILLKAARLSGSEYSSKAYARNYLYRREILMTLLEDGAISIEEFDKRLDSLNIQHHMDDQERLSKQFLNNFNSACRRIDSKKRLMDRLKDTLVKRALERLTTE